MAVLATLAIAGCTTIEAVNVNTVAIHCDVERGDSKQATGSGSAGVAERHADAAATFAGTLRSTIVCRDGTRAEAEVYGERTEP